jgi:hypothetical protein
LGSYDNSFSDLAAASQGLENANLASIVDHIRDLQSKGDAPPEFFGLKIPSSEAGKWGLVLLFATQFYFWIHLHELSNRIEPSDPGWEVAWVGVYPSKTAFVATLISSCILPVAVGALFGIRLTRSQSSLFGHHGLFVTAMILMNALIVAVALATAMSLFRLRAAALRSR